MLKRVWWKLSPGAFPFEASLLLQRFNPSNSKLLICKTLGTWQVTSSSNGILRTSIFSRERSTCSPKCEPAQGFSFFSHLTVELFRNLCNHAQNMNVTKNQSVINAKPRTIGVASTTINLSVNFRNLSKMGGQFLWMRSNPVRVLNLIESWLGAIGEMEFRPLR